MQVTRARVWGEKSITDRRHATARASPTHVWWMCPLCVSTGRTACALRSFLFCRVSAACHPSSCHIGHKIRPRSRPRGHDGSQGRKECTSPERDDATYIPGVHQKLRFSTRCSTSSGCCGMQAQSSCRRPEDTTRRPPPRDGWEQAELRTGGPGPICGAMMASRPLQRLPLAIFGTR